MLGPMFSGKSSELVHQINAYRAIARRVLVVNHAFDTRHDTYDVTTHDDVTPVAPRPVRVVPSGFGSAFTAVRTRVPALAAPPLNASVALLRLADLWTDPVHRAQLDAADVVCIDELQFFEDALEAVPRLCNDEGKHVVAAGLVADYRQRPFGDVLTLVAHADDVVHCKALCAACNDGTPGPFTQRLVADDAQVIVGANESYRAVCRRHYEAARATDEAVGYPYESDDDVAVVGV